MSEYQSLVGDQLAPSRKQDLAYARLRDWIITGALEHDQRIDETRMAERLGVSRIPLRHALGRLASESLVIERPHRGWVVSPMSLAGAEDVYAGRTALEVMLARTAAERRTDQDVSTSAAALQRQAKLIERGELRESRTWDREFHAAIYAGARMTHSLAAFQGLRLLSERYIHLYLDEPERASASLDEHRAIQQAFADGDGDRIAALTADHVQDGIIVLRGLLAPSTETA